MSRHATIVFRRAVFEPDVKRPRFEVFDAHGLAIAQHFDPAAGKNASGEVIGTADRLPIGGEQLTPWLELRFFFVHGDNDRADRLKRGPVAAFMRDTLQDRLQQIRFARAEPDELFVKAGLIVRSSLSLRRILSMRAAFVGNGRERFALRVAA